MWKRGNNYAMAISNVTLKFHLVSRYCKVHHCGVYQTQLKYRI